MTAPHPATTVIELRQYTLHAGQRDTLIDLFEREFIQTQEAEGLQVLGIFRDAEREDRFVWLRGFADMAARARGLAAFYGGPVWQAHRNAANATMRDSDDVLLLRSFAPWAPPARAAGAWQIAVWRRPAHFDGAVLRDSDATWLETETTPNNFPRLPVRENDDVLVALAPGAVQLPESLRQRLGAPLQTLQLQPTHRSPLR